MEHDKKSPLEPIKSSSCKFAVKYENQFVVLDDAKHVIGMDARDPSKLILENIENGSNVIFRGTHLSKFYISTLVFDEDTGSLYSGDNYGHVVQYKVNTSNQTCKQVKTYQDLGIGGITSSYRFLHFVFFGGDQSKIRVLDISTGKLLSGHINTSIKKICSFEVCMKNPKQIYLTVSGLEPDYSDDKTDLFDLSHFIRDNPDIFQKFLTDYIMNKNPSEEKSTNNLEAETIKNLTQERDFYKTKLTEMTTNTITLK